MEWAPILACDCHCPGCPYNSARSTLPGKRLPLLQAAPSDDRSSASLETARTVLERAREAGVSGVLFTGGGEPLLWPYLEEALDYSGRLGLRNALYTNGFRLGAEPRLADALLSPQHALEFIRISISAVSSSAFRSHWGFRGAELDATAQLSGLARLLDARNDLVESHRLRQTPSIQVSAVVNHQNVDDLEAVCAAVANIVSSHRKVTGKEDVMIVRPMTVYGRPSGFSTDDHDEQRVIRRIITQCGKGSIGEKVLRDVGIQLFLGFGLSSVESGEYSSYAQVIETEYARRDVSLANGIFLTVGQDGGVYPSTEYNCNPDFVLGDLKRQSVRDVYNGDKRKALLQRFNAMRWGPLVSHATARTSRLDRIARALHSGEVTESMLGAIRQHAVEHPGILLD